MKKRTLLGTAVALLLVVASALTGHAHRSRTLIAEMDAVMLDADFIGVVRVDKPAEAGPRVRLVVEETWLTRWREPTEFTFTPDDREGTLADELVSGARLVVWLSGGEWQRTPFTYREHSVFRIQDDATLACASHGTLFSATSSGFLCTEQRFVASPPLTLEVLHERVMQLHREARARRPGLDSSLSAVREFQGRARESGRTALGILR